MTSIVEKIKELVAAFKAKHPGYEERKRLQLTYVAAKRLQERGEEISVKNIVKEARRVIRESRETIDWGISEEKYTEAVAAPLLHELSEMGAIELDDKTLLELSKRLKKQKMEENVVPEAALLSRPL